MKSLKQTTTKIKVQPFWEQFGANLDNRTYQQLYTCGREVFIKS